MCQLHCFFYFMMSKKCKPLDDTNHCDKCQKRNSNSKKHCFYFFKIFICYVFLWFMLFLNMSVWDCTICTLVYFSVSVQQCKQVQRECQHAEWCRVNMGFIFPWCISRHGWDALASWWCNVFENGVSSPTSSRPLPVDCPCNKIKAFACFRGADLRR